VITDLRGAIAKREAGDGERADRLMAWVRDQAHANYLSVAETFDENDGTYKFNTPMVGFGAGAYALAVLHREGLVSEPACGAYYDMASGTGGAGGAGATTGVGGASASSGTGGAGGAGGTEPGTTTTSSGATGAGGGGASATPSDDGGCGCRVGPSAPHGAVAGLALALLSVLRRRARGKSRRP
jgi:MYXO-CTERM domain-containing protein